MAAVRKALGAALTTAVCVVLLTGCGLKDLRDDKGAGPAPVPSVSETFPIKAPLPAGKPLDGQAKVKPVPSPDPADPSAVARAWLMTAYSYDTAYDTGPQDANLRALGYLTDKQAEVERSYRPGAGSGAAWATWAEHKAWTTVEITADEDDQGPGDTPTSSFRTFLVDGKAHGRDGWTGTGPQLTAFVELTMTGPGTWKVAGVMVTPAAIPPSAAPSASASASASSSPSPSTTAR
ncbi:hypothetical protein [Streptomyces sp. RerS4]|uniref:hypothetical protein n=1 Tax=Streptomyces sp. RerS4 TaxID=2942449 RepID=UPI00201C38C0|nr:hypothetical protein [Streptomyces sp. RerS4]UQX02513.1 hypothetical protein M4D82_19985 [Streptomyces sp. RerS4]